MLICNDSCHAYDRILRAGTCDIINDRLEELAQVTQNMHFLLFVQAYKEFDCYDPTTYLFLDITDPDPTKCTHLFSPETEG